MPASGSRCFLVRHGETQWSRDGRHTGRTDLPLLPEGRSQAEALAASLGGHEFVLVLHSPRRRAAETCRLAGLGAGAVAEPDLAEWDYGTYEGRTTAEIVADRPGWELWCDGAPDGESPEQVSVRVDRVIARVQAQPGDVACIAHAHVLRALCARWIGLPVSGGRSFVLGPASVSVLGWERTRPVVDVWNRT